MGFNAVYFSPTENILHWNICRAFFIQKFQIRDKKVLQKLNNSTFPKLAKLISKYPSDFRIDVGMKLYCILCKNDIISHCDICMSTEAGMMIREKKLFG